MIKTISQLRVKSWRLFVGPEILLILLATLFVFTNAVSLSIVTEGRILWQHLFSPTIWLILMLSAKFFISRFRPAHDIYLLPVFGILIGWGLILIDRLAPNFLQRQLIWLAIGMVMLVLSTLFPKNLGFLRNYRYTWLFAGLMLLVATFIFGVNPSGQGATLWLKMPFLGRVFFQPSELLKLLLVVFLASYFAERRRLIILQPSKNWRGFLAYMAPMALMWGFCMILLVWQRDLGTATLFFAVFIALLYLATGDWHFMIGGAVLIMVAGLIGYFAYDVVTLRFDTWLNPWPEADSRGFQIVQSLYAVASGGIIGQGVAQGYPDFIPVVHSDFAYAAILEEWGLVGGLATLGFFAIVAYRGLRISILAANSFDLFLAAGISVMFSVQAFLIMAGVTKLLPLTGVTLPFVSYGGSSLLISCVMIGLLLNLSSRTR